MTCIDLSSENNLAAQAKGLKALQMDATAMSFPADLFDAVWSWDCLLHLPQVEWPRALSEIQRVLKPGGLFFLGVYGGLDFEGVWEEDLYRPKRFYSFMVDDTFNALMGRYFDPIDFHTHRISSAASDVYKRQALTAVILLITASM